MIELILIIDQKAFNFGQLYIWPDPQKPKQSHVYGYSVSSIFALFAILTIMIPQKEICICNILGYTARKCIGVNLTCI